MANDKRRRPRQTLNTPAWINARDDAPPLRCTVVDISETGARLAVSDAVSAPDEFDLILSHVRRPGRPCNVVWRLHGLIGIEFAPALTQAGDGAPADFGSLPIDGSVTAGPLRKLSTLLAGGLRLIRPPRGM
jgi:hypothetical protein